MSYPVARLKEDFGIGKQAEINRRKSLGIQSFKDTQSVTVISDLDHERLVKLDEFLKNNPSAKLTDFESSPVSLVQSTRVKSSDYTRPTVSNGQPIEMSASLTTTETKNDKAIVESPVETVNVPVTELMEWMKEVKTTYQSPVEKLRDLQEIADNGWLITTAQVHLLTGAKPHGTVFERGSFRFTKTGRIGREVGWYVDRV